MVGDKEEREDEEVCNKGLNTVRNEVREEACVNSLLRS
jgi:hypothetical protein